VSFVPKALREINFRLLRRELVWWCLAGIFLISLGLFWDSIAFSIWEGWRNESLNQVILFLTEFLIYGVLGMIFLYGGWQFYKDPIKNRNWLWVVLASILTIFIGYILKSVFAIPRPFVALEITPLLVPPSYSFPSNHAALMFSVLVPLWRISSRLGFYWFWLAFLVAVARVYEQVHYPSDVAAGMFLGGFMGALVSHGDLHRSVKILWRDLEFRRQSFHFLLGLFCVFLHWSGWLRLRWLALVLLLGLGISIWSQYRKIPVISDILELFDRPRDHDFPGRGAFYFLLGVFLSFLFFPVKVAYAAILIMAVGDSLNHLFGRNLKKFQVWWNPKKTWIGVGLGVVSGTIAAQFFVPVEVAFCAALVSIVVETITLKVGDFFIDDNIVVPLVAGGVIMLLS
jgi:dolichol kinase/membrane-associated phospholipid phosphatase